MLQDNNHSIEIFEDICKIRIYEIEKIVVMSRKDRDLPSAFFGGGFTGFFGLPGVPFNLVFTFLMYFRTVQSIACIMVTM